VIHWREATVERVRAQWPGAVEYDVRLAVAASADGTGVYGSALATSGPTIGVRGDSSSTNGIGALGIASATSGFIFGVDGRSHSPSGIGTRGLAYGNGTGVLGWSGTTAPPSGADSTQRAQSCEFFRDCP